MFMTECREKFKNGYKLENISRKCVKNKLRICIKTHELVSSIFISLCGVPNDINVEVVGVYQRFALSVYFFSVVMDKFTKEIQSKM